MKNLFIIFLFVFIIYLSTKFNNKYEYFSNNIEYVAWTGGFDSTYIICKFVLIDKKIVQPIYINPLNIDDCKNCSIKRKSKNKEIKTINNIINSIKQHKYYSNNLLPLIYIDTIKPNINITNDILYKYKFFYRKYNQYDALSRLSNQYKIFINIGFVDVNNYNSKFAIYLKKHLKLCDNNKNYRIVFKDNPLYYLKFPIAFFSKHDLLENSKKFNFDSILYMTWSCWFPKNNKACGKCPMCKERIIPQIY